MKLVTSLVVRTSHHCLVPSYDKIMSALVLKRSVFHLQGNPGVHGKRVISVSCKSHKGELHCNRYLSGIRGQCIRYKDKWLTPQEFGTTCGGANGRKYLEIIQTDYGPLGALTKSGTLKPSSAKKQPEENKGAKKG